MSTAPTGPGPVLLQRDGAVARITLNRPDAGNAIDLPLAYALGSAALDCETDPAVRCVVLTGAGRLFCAGGDIAAFTASPRGAGALLNELAGALHVALLRLSRMPKPLLVLVNGPAAGAGLSLAIAGDIVLAARSAHFTAAYGQVGLTPDGGMSWRLPKLIGLRKAQAMILENRRVDAAEAEAIGLVTRTVEDAALTAEGQTAAERLCAAPTLALGGARNLLLDGAASTLEAHLERETRAIAAAGDQAECREGVSAFLARRKPDFRGASGVPEAHIVEAVRTAG